MPRARGSPRRSRRIASDRATARHQRRVVDREERIDAVVGDCGLDSFSGCSRRRNGPLRCGAVREVHRDDRYGALRANFSSYRSRAFLSVYSRRMAALLPASIGLPPPMATTACAPKERPSATASSTLSTVGLGVHFIVQRKGEAACREGLFDVIPGSGGAIGTPAAHDEHPVDPALAQFRGDIRYFRDGPDARYAVVFVRISRTELMSMLRSHTCIPSLNFVEAIHLFSRRAYHCPYHRQ